MPKISGIDFLSILKKNINYCYIPVIILTTSNNQKDLLECYRLGISGYILKPLKYDDYVEKIKATLNYWTHNEFIFSNK
jgi:DNA-binding NarL/FixJ family response regulator